jgi:hypothetical protein
MVVYTIYNEPNDTQPTVFQHPYAITIHGRQRIT